MFIAAMRFFDCSALKRVSMSDHECKIPAAIMNFNSNDPFFALRVF